MDTYTADDFAGATAAREVVATDAAAARKAANDLKSATNALIADAMSIAMLVPRDEAALRARDKMRADAAADAQNVLADASDLVEASRHNLDAARHALNATRRNDRSAAAALTSAKRAHDATVRDEDGGRPSV